MQTCWIWWEIEKWLELLEGMLLMAAELKDERVREKERKRVEREAKEADKESCGDEDGNVVINVSTLDVRTGHAL